MLSHGRCRCPPQWRPWLPMNLLILYFYFFQTIKQCTSRVACHQQSGPSSLTQNYTQVKRPLGPCYSKCGLFTNASVYSIPCSCCITNTLKLSKVNNKVLSHSFCGSESGHINWGPLAQSLLAKAGNHCASWGCRHLEAGFRDDLLPSSLTQPVAVGRPSFLLTVVQRY